MKRIKEWLVGTTKNTYIILIVIAIVLTRCSYTAGQGANRLPPIVDHSECGIEVIK